MIRKDVIGLYLEKDLLCYSSASRGVRGWLPKKPAPGMSPCGSIRGRSLSRLATFLDDISAPKNKRFYLGLPREYFFARDISFPPMAPEDALEAARNSLQMSSHLSEDEIYYDIALTSSDKGVNALIIYAPRVMIDPYLEVFRTAGLYKALKAVFPISAGVGALLSPGRKGPFAVKLNHGDLEEVAVFGKKSCLSSLSFQPDDHEEADTAAAGLMERFPGLDVLALEIDGAAASGPFEERNPGFPPFMENLGVAAMGAGLGYHNPLHIDPTPPRVRVFKPLWVIIPLFIFLCAGAYALTGRMELSIAEKKQSLTVLKKEVRELKARLAPLEKKRADEKNAAAFKSDVNDFIESRPGLFTLLNEIADIVPENTWFTRFSYRGMVFTLNGESPDAMKTIELIRDSDIFEQVKLSGSVSRRSSSGKERFAMKITLKNPEGDAGR